MQDVFSGAGEIHRKDNCIVNMIFRSPSWGRSQILVRRRCAYKQTHQNYRVTRSFCPREDIGPSPQLRSTNGTITVKSSKWAIRGGQNEMPEYLLKKEKRVKRENSRREWELRTLSKPTTVKPEDCISSEAVPLVEGESRIRCDIGNIIHKSWIQYDRASHYLTSPRAVYWSLEIICPYVVSITHLSRSSYSRPTKRRTTCPPEDLSRTRMGCHSRNIYPSQRSSRTRSPCTKPRPHSTATAVSMNHRRKELVRSSPRT